MWTDDGRTTEASHTKSSPGAFGSGELKSRNCFQDLKYIVLYDFDVIALFCQYTEAILEIQ